MQYKPDTSTVIGNGPSNEILKGQLFAVNLSIFKKIWILLAMADKGFGKLGCNL